MVIDNSVQLENRPLVLQVEDNSGVVTYVESPVLDLQEVHVTKYNYLLKVAKKMGGASKIKSTITSESDINLLSLAVLNPEEAVLTIAGEPFALSSTGQDFGAGDTKTFRKFCQAVSVTSALYDESGNFTSLDSGSVIELSFKASEAEGASTFGQNLILDVVATAVVDGYTKLVSVSGKCFDGTTITLDAKADGTLGLQVGDSCWIEYTVRNEGLVVSPKVTGLNAPVDGSDAVNLDFVEGQVANLESADAENLAYIDSKVQELSELVVNQDSFFASTQVRWNGPRALVMDDGLLSLPNMSQLSGASSVIGLALTNPAIDESGLTEEQIALSYSRRVYTSGMVRNVVAAWNSPKGDVFAGPNGTLVESAPLSGRIIRLGQKVGTRDLLLSIQDYGFVYGIQSLSKGYDFGKLTPTPPPYPQNNAHFIGLGRPSTEGMFGGGWKSSLFKINSDNRLDPEISLSEFQTSDTSKYELGSAAKFPDGSGNFVVMSYYPRLNGLGDDTINNVDNNLGLTVPPRPNYILKFNAEGQLIGSCLAPLSDIELPRRKIVYENETLYFNDGEGVFSPLMLLPMANGSIAYIAYVHNINGFSGYDGFAAQLKQMYPEEADSHGPWSIRMWIINPDMTVSSESTWLEGSPIIPIERYGAQSEGFWHLPFWTLVKPDFPIFGQVVSEDGDVMFPVLTSDDIQDYFKPIWFFGNGKVVEGQSEIDWGAQLVNPRLKLVKISGDGSVNYIDLCDATPFNRQNWWNQLNTLVERSSEMAIVTSDGTYALGTTLGIIKVSSDNVVTNLPIPQEIIGINSDGSSSVNENMHIEKLLDLFEREDGSIVFRGLAGDGSWGYYFVGVLNADNTYEPVIIIPDVYDSIMKGVLRNNGTYLLVEDVSSGYHVVDLSTRQVTKFTPDLNSLFGDNNPFIYPWNSNPQYTDFMWQWRQSGSFYNKENDSFIFGGRFEDWIPETDEYKQGVMLLAIKDDNTMVEVTTPETRFSGISIQVVI